MRKTKIRTDNFFNLVTQRALAEKLVGYVNKEFYAQQYIAVIQAKYNLEKIYRLDLGQNNDGCSREVEARYRELSQKQDLSLYIKDYPEFICWDLLQKIAALHRIPREEWILFSAGLDQMIGIIAAAFLQLNDRIMVNSPSFYLFEEYSRRMGAIPIYLQLWEEEGFEWNTETFDEYRDILKKFSPRLIWLANPNNPTGGLYPNDLVEYIVDEAANYFAFVVVDEAYGEYVDPDGGVNSASRLLDRYDNLIVLRTFSKAYGLASLRIAYALSSNPYIIQALRLHRAYFPITQLSFDVATAALEHIGYLGEVREKTARRKEYLTRELQTLPQVSYIDSQTNIMMIKHDKLSDEGLIHHLEQSGIIVARVPGEEDLCKKYIRMTLGKEEENRYFIEALRKIKA